MVRPTTCDCCAGKCHERCHTVSVADTLGMREGDEVELATSESAFALVCGVMFLLPAALFVVALAWHGVLAGCLALAVYFALAYRPMNGVLTKMLAPRAVRVLRRAGEQETPEADV